MYMWMIMRMILLFLMQLAICETCFLVGLPRRKKFGLRVALAVPEFLFLVYLLFVLRRYIPDGGINILREFKGIAFFGGIIFANALMVLQCFEVKYREALFAVIGGYSIEHIASRFSYILQAVFYGEKPMEPLVEFGVFDFLIPVIFALAIYYLLIQDGIRSRKISYGDRKTLVISGINLFICIVLSVYEPDRGDGSVHAIMVQCATYIFAILGCSLCLLLQAGYFKEGELDEKNRLLMEMLEREREKQKLSRETIDIINRKCHDLRKQISLLERMTPEAREKSLKSISDAVLIYDSLSKTGNSTVDLVLMEKKLFCEQYGIQFSCLVDGSKFDFMDETDIYAMLGNLLDNAIESVVKEDKEKRIITLNASARGEMLYLCMENTCTSPVTFKDGLPQTSKDDAAYHGFGTQSIRYIAESYGGTVRFTPEANFFVVEVLIPIGAKKVSG